MCESLLQNLWCFVCAIFCGLPRSFWHALTGYCRPYPVGTAYADGMKEEARKQHYTGYAQRPYSVWKGVFLAYVWESACVELNRDAPGIGPGALRSELIQKSEPYSQPWQGYTADQLFKGYDGKDDGNDNHDTPAKRLGITRSILQKAGAKTRDRLTSELSIMMTVCTFIGGFLFTTLVNRSESNTKYASWDVYGMLAGVTVILALICVGIYARLVVMLQWSATSTSLYRTISRWERAMSGNQLMFYLIITGSLASALAACWDKYPSPYHPVFIVLAVVAGFAHLFFTYFWAESMWCTDHGILHQHTKLFYKRLLDIEDGVHRGPEGAQTKDVYGKGTVRPCPQPVDLVRYTFYGLVDQYLMGGLYPP